MHNLLEQLVNIPSVTGSELEIGRFLVDECTRRGYNVRTQIVSQDRFNIVATLNAEPTVLFNTHMDTVPEFIPFSRKGNICYGRGACDAKGQITAMLTAGDKLKSEGITRFGFLFVVGEEVISDGAKKAASLDVNSTYVIVGEPTDNRMAIGQKGILVFNVHASGTGGHSSQPEKGVSANHEIIGFLTQWLNRDWGTDPLLGKNLVNVGTLEGGTGINILAPKASARGIFRVATPLDELRQQIFHQLPELIHVEELSASPPQKFITLPGYDTFVAGFGTDAAYVRPLGKVVLFGPGSIEHAHRDNEQIHLNELHQAVVHYTNMVKALIKLGK